MSKKGNIIFTDFKNPISLHHRIIIDRKTEKLHEFPGINSLNPNGASEFFFIELLSIPGSIRWLVSVLLLYSSLTEHLQQNSEKNVITIR